MNPVYAILTGQGRFFCAGTDLSSWAELGNTDDGFENYCDELIADVNGLGAISRRSISSKPIIAAVNGNAIGGAVEMLLNCDLVVASEEATFTMPEAKWGVAAFQGGTPRLAKIAGLQRASEVLFLGKKFSAQDACNRFRFVNKVVPKDEVMTTALDWAQTIAKQSPETIQSTKRALVLTNHTAGVEDVVVKHLRSSEGIRMFNGKGFREGLTTFIEKRAPIWRNAAKL